MGQVHEPLPLITPKSWKEGYSAISKLMLVKSYCRAMGPELGTFMSA